MSSTARPRQRRLPPRLPRHLRGRVAALGIVAALMVALPLSLLLRRQQTELDELAARRSVLDPIARSVDAQRSLLLHRGAAGRALRGQAGIENERRAYQAEVDERLAALAIALAVGPWERAVEEGDALRQDWSLLLRRYAERRLSAEESDQSHALMIEQTLQIVDLLDLAPNGRGVDKAEHATATNATLVPRRRAVPTQASLQAERLALDARAGSIRSERHLVLLAMLVLALVAWRLARPVRAVAVDHRGQPGPQAQAVEAGRLFDRLRRNDGTPSELPPDSRLGDVRQP